MSVLNMNVAGCHSIRPVEILVGAEAIASSFGVGAKTVRKWEKRGAPIVRDGRGVLRAEKWELWCWVRA